MAKPLVLPRWANVGGSIATPSSGKQDIGWLPGERPTPQHANWLHNLSYEWLNFLNPLFTANGGFVAPVNEHVQVSGTGLLKHGPRPMALRGSAFQGSGGNAQHSSTGVVSCEPGGGVFTATCAIPLPAGARIVDITVWYDRGGSGTVTPSLRRYDFLTDTQALVTTPGFTGDSTGTGIESQNSGVINHDISSTHFYIVAVDLTGTPVTNRLFGAVINYDQP